MYISRIGYNIINVVRITESIKYASGMVAIEDIRIFKWYKFCDFQTFNQNIRFAVFA